MRMTNLKKQKKIFLIQMTENINTKWMFHVNRFQFISQRQSFIWSDSDNLPKSKFISTYIIVIIIGCDIMLSLLLWI